MTYPYYCVVNQSEYNYVRASLDSFGYDVSLMSEEYLEDWDCIVLDSNGKFGVCNDLPDGEHIREKRTLITDVEIFLNEAEKLLKGEKKQTKSRVVSIEEIKKAFNIKPDEELIIVN